MVLLLTSYSYVPLSLSCGCAHKCTSHLLLGILWCISSTLEFTLVSISILQVKCVCVQRCTPRFCSLRSCFRLWTKIFTTPCQSIKSPLTRLEMNPSDNAWNASELPNRTLFIKPRKCALDPSNLAGRLMLGSLRAPWPSIFSCCKATFVDSSRWTLRVFVASLLKPSEGLQAIVDSPTLVMQTCFLDFPFLQQGQGILVGCQQPWVLTSVCGRG